MKSWKVVYGAGVRDDFFALVDRITDDGELAAAKTLDRLEARILSLYRFPERGRVVGELHWHGITAVREIFEKPWRILYKIGDDAVLVLAVYDGRRRLDDVLLERFLR